MTTYNPTQDIELNFLGFAQERESNNAAHMIGGIPDYAFAMDLAIRQKIKAAPGVFPFFKAIVSTVVPRQKQMLNLNCLKVGPNQYPEIYNMAVECASILGIGIPTIFIEPNPAEINAYTLAIDDELPLVVLTSALVERMTKGELKYVIGHECGHIHNNHNVYNIAARLILDAGLNLPFIGPIINMVTLPVHYLFNTWSRAAEVTSDRAGIICSNDIMDSVKANAKFMHGGILGADEADIDSILKQYESVRSSPVRFLEFESSHPITVRRIFAAFEFQKSEVLYSWRPEFRQPGTTAIGKDELDARCEKYVSVMKGREGKE